MSPFCWSIVIVYDSVRQVKNNYPQVDQQEIQEQFSFYGIASSL